ncbi:MAG: hypothetical protein V4524_01855 [Patescibacteria group bacterium]
MQTHIQKNIYNSGQVIILNTILFLAISLLLINGVAYPIISHYSATLGLMQSKQAFLLADSATNEALYRLKNSKTIGSTGSITLGSSTAMIAIANTASGKRITVTSPGNAYQRNIQIDLTLGTGIAFHYGIQSGEGGFTLDNSSTITGNVFSGGSVTSYNKNVIYGDVISSGPTGLINGVIASSGNLYAHTLLNSAASKDAYYFSTSTIDSYTTTHTTGTKHPGSTDQPTVPLPIDDDQIHEWEADAATGGTVVCTNGSYTISSDMPLGPKKIPCNLNISGNGTTLTATGHLWVVGNITMTQSSKIAISPGLGSQNVAIIADNPSASTTSGTIDLGQGSSFSGSGSANSFVFMIAQNSSAENGGSTQAISVGQSSTALVGYAIHGLISLSQSVSLKEVTAYKIALTQSANVTYDTGLPNTLFEAGPGGGYNILGWSEI